MAITLKNNKRVLYHTIYWLIYIFLYPVLINILYPSQHDGIVPYYLIKVQVVALSCFYIILTAYFITYILIPRLLIKKKIIYLLISYLITFTILTFFHILFSKYVRLPFINTEYTTFYQEFYSKILSFKLLFYVSVLLQTQVLPFIIVRFFINYLKDFFEREKLKTKMVESELNMLKSQIHPHFLFNTLNNIYTLSIDGDNKKVSETIIKLSDILRYTIYECDNKFISLNKEITVIKNYIELEKLRYSSLRLETSFPSNINHIYVIPLLFFTFVENAFKHGTSKSVENKWLEIKHLIFII